MRRPTRGRVWPLAAVVLVAALAAAGCGGGEEEKFSDRKIVDALGLEKVDSTYAMNGDPFCSVESLFNDSEAVDAARDSDQASLLIASGQGNVGVEVVPPFAPDCKRDAKQALNELDPKPKEE